MPGDELERKTRRERVDPKLRAAGWTVQDLNAPRAPSSAVREYPTANGPADYALVSDANRVLGVVEAKKLRKGPQEVLKQAERYSRGLRTSFSFDGYGVPFLYSTNGEVTWFRDARHDRNRRRQVPGFHTPAALSEMFERDFEGDCKTLSATPNDHPKLRPYQKEANDAVERAISDRRRAMLLVMATGTGKTFTMANQVYRLMRAGVARRVLFLVDRRALAAQAVREFASFDAERGMKFDQIYEVYSQRFQRDDFEDDVAWDPKMLPSGYLTDPHAGLSFVYICTIQRMAVNLFGATAAAGFDDAEDEHADEQEDVDRLSIPHHAFDLVVADECHRGYTSQELSLWRDTLDHFDAIKIGLTATPAAHTTAYFKHVPYRYEYERAVREGYLVDYDVVRVKSGVRIRGVFLKPGEQVGHVDPETGLERLDRLEDEREYATTDIERRVTSPDSNKKILQEVRRYALEHKETYGRYPKILIFAVNDVPHTSHAEQLVRVARDVFDEGDTFVEKITGTVDRPLRRIREFRNRPVPIVAVTVDLLTTGIDIPDLEFLVLLRPVKSRILFEQMLGRGTRRGERFLDKSHFTVFDCFDGSLLDYFRHATGITAEPPDRPSRTTAELIEDVWQNRDREYALRCLVLRLHRVNREMSGDARDLFSAYLPAGDVGVFARGLHVALEADFGRTMKLLRDPGFQDLLENFPRPNLPFVVAYETEDQVSSEWMIRGLDGKEYRPEDYVAAFENFVRENRDRISAIEVLLHRPQKWNAAVLVELREHLTRAPQRFTLKQLQAAHKLHFGKALVDIISMVKHAANHENELLTAEERVSAAIATLTKRRRLSAEQRDWLDRIHRHLVENLSIEPGDFNDIPVFARAGGLAQARRTFGQDFSGMLRDLNAMVAA